MLGHSGAINAAAVGAAGRGRDLGACASGLGGLPVEDVGEAGTVWAGGAGRRGVACLGTVGVIA